MLALPYGRPGSELIFAYSTLCRSGPFSKGEVRNEGLAIRQPLNFLMDSWQAWEQTAPQLKRLRAKAEEIARAMAEGRRR